MSRDTAALEKELNDMIAAGQAMDAFEKFYSDDIVMKENTQEAREGKDTCRAYEEAFFGNVAEFHEGSFQGGAVEGDRSYSEWVFDVTFKDGSRMRNHQVAARRWKDGKVVFEQFFYEPNVTPGS